MIEVVCLTVYGIVVALFGPALLRRLTSDGHVPRLGVAAWLTAALSMLSAWFVAGVHAAVHGSPTVRAVAIVLICAIAARISWAVARTVRRTATRRAGHEQALLLVGRQDDDLGALIVTASAPLIYCLPCGPGLIVVTTGALAALTTEELRAALAHERAHLAGRHHALMMMGYALSRVLPSLPLLRTLGRQVAVLLEMSADDHAGRLHGRQTVARAIAAMAAHAVPAGALGAGGPSSTVRVRRLSSPRSEWRSRILAAAATATVVFLALGPYLATIDPWCSRYHV